MSISRPAAIVADVFYPTSDGKPMGETPLHRKIMQELIDTLEDRYADDPDVYVSGNMIMYYVEGNPHKQIVPDVFVAFGVRKDPDRDIYQIWREGKGPDVVFEVSSASTSGEDQKEKKLLYAKVLKVKEYFLFDPRGEYLEPSLQGFVLQRGKYVPLKPVKGRLSSTQLGLLLVPEGQRLRLLDPAENDWLLTPAEKYDQAEEDRKRSDMRRRKTEEARRQAEKARRQAEEARRQAAEASKHHEEARKKAEESQRRSEEARVEVERENELLRQELEKLRDKNARPESP